ncbi:hypothetical protein V496_00426 [Pseudogymnoascus sp. VKM F-4515 (FW-2607)]|nr:hypothetical protein V496_00426 [Pseudogymnoascus sp. VKM F-4515 (FW-2607)]
MPLFLLIQLTLQKRTTALQALQLPNLDSTTIGKVRSLLMARILSIAATVRVSKNYDTRSLQSVQPPVPHDANTKDPHLYTPSLQTLVVPASKLGQHKHTQKEKMLCGENFLLCDPELVGDRERCNSACWRFNNDTNPDNSNNRNPSEDPTRLFRDILQPNEVAGISQHPQDYVLEPSVAAPFNCHYGYNITIGQNVSIGRGCTIIDCVAVKIGDNCVIGPNVTILTTTPPISSNEQMDSKGQNQGKPVIIEKNCFIGANVTILQGTKVGAGSAVGIIVSGIGLSSVDESKSGEVGVIDSGEGARSRQGTVKMVCETYQVTWGWSPIDDPKNITWFLPSGTNIEHSRTYDFGASEKWEAQLDENNEFTIQLHYSRGDKVTHWETVTGCFIEPLSLVFFEIGHCKESFSKESCRAERYLRETVEAFAECGLAVGGIGGRAPPSFGQFLDAATTIIMSAEHSQGSILDAPFDDFAASLLPLYVGPLVTIRIGSATPEYKLPKALLCKQSSYFASMFNGNFKEGEEQSATLEEIDGVVSAGSFQMLAQWVCVGRVVLGMLPLAESITSAIEFARLADMCGVVGVESLMAEVIKSTIIDNPGPYELYAGSTNSHTHYITLEHIISAAFLPDGHPVRNVLALATVEGYLNWDDHKFSDGSSQVPSFSTDLLVAVKTALRSMSRGDNSVTFTEPISGEKLSLRMSE